MEKIGCITLVRRNGYMVGIKCSKGRGIILPGGKWEANETFVETARRELKEEAGLDGHNFKLVFGGPDGFGYYTFAFTAQVFSFDNKSEEEVVLCGWDDLLKSHFKAYYSALHSVMVP